MDKGPMDEKRIMIRTTVAFHDVLARMAEEQKRSLNNALLTILEDAVADYLGDRSAMPPSRPPKDN